MKKYITLFLIPLFILLLISCNENLLDDEPPVNAAIPTESTDINSENFLVDAQYCPLISLEFEDSSNYWGRPMMGFSVNMPKELIDTFELKPEEGQDYIILYYELRLYDRNANLKKSSTYGSFLHDGEINFEDTDFLWYIYDLTENGVYALAVYVEYFDKEFGKDIFIHSAPLFIYITIETDDSVVEITAEETREGTLYSLKGDIYLDAIYGFTHYSDGTTDNFLYFVYLGKDGGLIRYGGSNIDDYADVQRFYDFVFEGNKVHLKMVLPKTLSVSFVYDYDDFHDESNEKAPAEEAYMEVFQEFYPRERLLERTKKDEYYISVDLEGVLYEYPELIKARIEEYLKDTGVSLLWENMDSLIEKGYILTDENGFPIGFERGSLFVFQDSVLTDIMYESNTYKWYGNLGAEGATYKVRMRSGKWGITSITNKWIS